ncbi:MAG: NADH-quinone oxidoreductase subunit F, partial [Clostridiales bacterium]|nr:NADH-quinone oxidoreductase subunit F [Clostridiales bacterium]
MKSLKELEAIKEQGRGLVQVRHEGATESESSYHYHVMVCGGTGCTSSGSGAIIEEFHKQLAANGIEDKVQVVRTGCFGLCELGPVVIVYPEGSFYSRVKVEDVAEITEKHLKNGEVVKSLLYSESVAEDGSIKALEEVNFFKKQHRVALRNCGVIDPQNINEYIAFGGYEALGKVLTTMQPMEVINLVKASGLRGRGGAGFPTGLKWQFASGYQDDQKYVLCNADEGDPGAFMDRSILEGDPHVVIEAMSIAGYAIGATQGYVYVRAEYPIAVQRLQIAIDQAREAGILGENIFGSGFSFDLGIRLGAGAFVCGEETALMRSKDV